MFENEFKNFIDLIKTRLREKTLQKYFHPKGYQGYTIFGGADKLIRRSDRLFNAMLGNTKEGIEEFNLRSGNYKYVFKVLVPYSRLHEKGGIITITPKMRRFFWFQYFVNKNQNPELARAYKNIALFKESLKYPARAYFEPSIREAFESSVEGLVKSIKEKLKLSFIEK